MNLTDVRAIVSGAARGLGRHFVIRLVGAGATVAAGDVNGAGLRMLKDATRSMPGRLISSMLDVSDEASVQEFVGSVAAKLEGLNVLINNAGILRDGLLVAKDADGVRKLPLPQWKKVIDTNLTGQFLMTREAAATMVENGTRGVIVNISSLARSGNEGQSNYAAAKSGLDADTRTWALELARYGIRVGGVAPGVIDTPILEGISNEALAKLRSAIPLGRFGTCDEVWMAVKFIIECEFFSARTIEVDGGALMGSV